MSSCFSPGTSFHTCCPRSVKSCQFIWITLASMAEDDSRGYEGKRVVSVVVALTGTMPGLTLGAGAAQAGTPHSRQHNASTATMNTAWIAESHHVSNQRHHGSWRRSSGCRCVSVSAADCDCVGARGRVDGGSDSQRSASLSTDGRGGTDSGTDCHCPGVAGRPRPRTQQSRGQSDRPRTQCAMIHPTQRRHTQPLARSYHIHGLCSPQPSRRASDRLPTAAHLHITESHHLLTRPRTTYPPPVLLFQL